jgi:membrane protease YdiL (CAAX protease family)
MDAVEDDGAEAPSSSQGMEPGSEPSDENALMAAGEPFGARPPAIAVHTPWTFRQTLIGAGLTLIPWLVFALGSQLLTRGTPAPAHPHRLAQSVDLAQAAVLFVISAALEAVFLIAPLYYAIHTVPPGAEGRDRWRVALRALGLRLPDPGLALSAAVLAIAVILGASVVYSDILSKFHSPLKTNVDTLLAQAQYEPYTVIGTLLVAVLVAPFCEEMFFRGYLFPGLARGMQLWLAVLVSSALFGLAHADLGSFVVLFIIGIVLAVVRARTDSLWPGIAVHTLNNTIAFISILVLIRH